MQNQTLIFILHKGNYMLCTRQSLFLSGEWCYKLSLNYFFSRSAINYPWFCPLIEFVSIMVVNQYFAWFLLPNCKVIYYGCKIEFCKIWGIFVSDLSSLIFLVVNFNLIDLEYIYVSDSFYLFRTVFEIFSIIFFNNLNTKWIGAI